MAGDVSISGLQGEIRQKGELIFSKMSEEKTSLFNKDWWYGRIMDWSMKNEHFKTQMFRFVDVLPYLNSGQEVAKHLKEYFAEGGEEIPSVFNFGLGLGSLAPSLLAGAVKKNVTQMAKMFITGETPEDALPVLKKGRSQKMCFTADLLGEATLSEKEAIDYQRRYLELIQWLSDDSKNWKEEVQIDRDENGPIPKVNISVKVTALNSQIDEAAWDESLNSTKERLRPIFREAIKREVFINLDMEQYAHKDFILQVFEDLILEPEFKNYPHWGIVIQAYLKDSLKDCEKMVALAKRRGVPFTVRLVKGAYWDFEIIFAQQKGWDIPVYMNKKETDANYESCCELLLKAYPHLRVAIGSHNVRSISTAVVIAEKLGLDPRVLEVQMLYGMAEPIKRSIVNLGIRLREYATIGELIPGMAYLVRRLLENTSNESFLKSKFADDVSTEVLLANPRQNIPQSFQPEQATASDTAVVKYDFENEPPIDFALPDARKKMMAALASEKAKFGQECPIVINGKEQKGSSTITRTNPSHPDQVVGKIHMADIAQADQAIKVACETLKTWSKTSPEYRADILDKVADLMDRDRYELSALEVYEVGKNWREADGDVAEAIDFCRYYAKEMRNLSKPQRVGHAPGEVSLYQYQARGVSLVIAPWNFPLAILAGMVTASFVAGNTVIMKPAEQSSIISYRLMKLLLEAGLPAGVVSHLPGAGETVGDYLVKSPKVSLIAFTGSKEVGLMILRNASVVHPGQTHVKKCIIEMGGKNAIIIDADADLDEAVQGVVYSAFGFQGQKCSACSRVIVLDSIYERFVERLQEATKSLRIGFAEHPLTIMGPVVDEESQQRILKTIESAKTNSPLLYQGEVPREGNFVPPTLFVDVDPLSDLAQKEIFGPVLAIIRAKNLDQALEIANGTEFALTGAVYSRSPANIEKVKAEFEVGNLYVNRGSTGALVDRHPFGGFKMSGVGSKTGGPDYLIQFMEPRVITENTVRRGFAPAELTE